MRLKAIAAGFACTLCFAALADDRLDDGFEPNFQAVDRVFFGEKENRTLDEEQLGKLRAGMPTPVLAGVVLWDEPRKAPPPVRNVNEPQNGSSLNATVTINMKSP